MGRNLYNLCIISFCTTARAELHNLLSNVCVCMSLCLCVCRYTCICAHVGARGHPGVFFLKHCLPSLRHDPSFTWSSSRKLGCLVSSRDLPSLPLLPWDYKCVPRNLIQFIHVGAGDLDPRVCIMSFTVNISPRVIFEVVILILPNGEALL